MVPVSLLAGANLRAKLIGCSAQLELFGGEPTTFPQQRLPMKIQPRIRERALIARQYVKRSNHARDFRGSPDHQPIMRS